MESEAQPGKAGGGLLTSIGRLFGRGQPDRRDAGRDEPPADRPEEPARTHGPEEARDESGDDEDELVLGPSLQASATPRDDEEASEDDLRLGERAGDQGGDQGGDEAGEPAASEAEADDDAEAILARLRSVREHEESDSAGEKPLTTSEEEWTASFGAAVPEEDGPKPDLSWRPSAEAGEGDPNAEAGETYEAGETARDDDAPTEASESERPAASSSTVPLFPGVEAGSDEEDAFDESSARIPEHGSDAEEETGRKEAAVAESGSSENEDEKAESGPREAKEREAGDHTVAEDRDDEPEGDDQEEIVNAATEEEPSDARVPEAEVSTAEAPAVAQPEADTDDEASEDDETAADPSETEKPEPGLSGPDEVASGEPGTEKLEDEEPKGEASGAAAPSAEEDEPSGSETEDRVGALPIGGAEGHSAAEPEDSRADAGGEEAAGAGALDEGAVEEIVRRVVREEMEGDLGERLSANIRRMIHEEVQRAMLRQR